LVASLVLKRASGDDLQMKGAQENNTKDKPDNPYDHGQTKLHHAATKATCAAARRDLGARLARSCFDWSVWFFILYLLHNI
jgi:hypothetical protein